MIPLQQPDVSINHELSCVGNLCLGNTVMDLSHVGEQGSVDKYVGISCDALKKIL